LVGCARVAELRSALQKTLLAQLRSALQKSNRL
jgi:hypothetical protein